MSGNNFSFSCSFRFLTRFAGKKARRRYWQHAINKSPFDSRKKVRTRPTVVSDRFASTNRGISNARSSRAEFRDN